MIRKCAGIVLMGLALSSNAQAEQAAPPAGEQAASPALQEINALGEVAMQTGLQAIQESGGLYPFAIVGRTDGQTQLVGYQGDPELRPPAEEWGEALFLRLRELAAGDDTIKVAALVRLHNVPAKEEGDPPIPGLWVLVDHRDERAWVLFMPFLPNKDTGKRTPGDVIYYATDQPLFPTGD